MARTRFFRSGKKPVKVPTIIRHTPGQEVTLKLIPHAHLKAIADGRGGEEEFLTITFRTLVGASLTGFADDADQKHLEEIFQAATEALISMGERYTRLSKFGTSGDELIRIKAALNLTDDLQDVATKREQAEMYKQVEGFVGAFDFTMKNLRLLKERYQQPAEIS